ncbi:MAG: Calx-beta domain-containing protein, partial [Pseudomonadota bacterium]
MPIAILLSQRLRWLLTGITLLIPLFASAQAQPTCGAPAFTVPGHYLSQDCSSGRWSVHAWSGSNFRALSGSVESEEPLQHILRRSIENSDQIAITQGNRRIAWTMKVVGRGRDELQFAPAPGTEACLKVTGPVFHRSAAQSLAAEVAIPGLGACGGVPATPTLSIDDATATESAGSVTLSVSLSLPTTSAVQVRIATEDDTAEANTDYQPLMQQQVIDFAPGETEKPITVTLIDDDLQEDPERFRLQLSDAIGADIEADGGAVVTIVDGNGPGCGRPTYSSGTEAALYVYTDCASSQLLIEAASGGPFIQYNAELTSEAPIEVARRIGIETSDRIELRDGNQTLSLTLKTTGVGTDAVALELDPGVRSCLRLQQPLNLIRYGSEAIPANNELDPATGGPCDSTPLPATLHVSDQTVREEQGQMQFTVELRNATDSTTTVGVMVEDLDATVGTDYVAETLPTILSFAPSEETKQIPIQLLNDSLEEGPEQFAVQLDMPQNALLAGSGRAVVTIEDDDVRCGAPAAANRQQAGLYLFRDCASQRYRVEAQAAGRFVALMGTLQSSSELLNPQGIGLEASDSLDTRSDPSALSFTFKVTGRGVDAAEFGLEPLASGCFERTAPNDAPVFYGPAAQAMPASFDITTGTECAAGIPQVSVLDQTLAESDPSGAMRFIVTLSQPAATTVLISYETRDGDATGDVDYVPQAGQIAIPAGALTATVDIPLLDDVLSEDDERFSLHLLNTSVNARLQHPTATGVIIDDETQELTLSSTSATEAEGVARVELAIAAPATQTITAAYRTREGSALQNEDYPHTEGSIEFPPGTTRVVIEIPLIADSEDERAENFFLDVFDANGVNIGESSAMITILPARYNVVVILT